MIYVSVQRDMHELFTRSAGNLLDHWFESDAVKALYGFDAVVGSYASPYTPGSAYVMGAITQAMATEARRLGATLETAAPAKPIAANLGPKPLS